MKAGIAAGEARGRASELASLPASLKALPGADSWAASSAEGPGIRDDLHCRQPVTTTHTLPRSMHSATATTRSLLRCQCRTLASVQPSMHALLHVGCQADNRRGRTGYGPVSQHTCAAHLVLVPLGDRSGLLALCFPAVASVASKSLRYLTCTPAPQSPSGHSAHASAGSPPHKAASWQRCAQSQSRCSSHACPRGTAADVSALEAAV